MRFSWSIFLVFAECIYGSYILPMNIQRPEKSIIFGKVMLLNEYSYNHRLFHYEIVVWSLLNATYLGSVTQFVMEPFCLNLCLLMGVCISITKIVNVYTSYDFLFQILFLLSKMPPLKQWMSQIGWPRINKWKKGKKISIMWKSKSRGEND